MVDGAFTYLPPPDCFLSPPLSERVRVFEKASDSDFWLSISTSFYDSPPAQLDHHTSCSSRPVVPEFSGAIFTTLLIPRRGCSPIYPLVLEPRESAPDSLGLC